MGNIMHGVRSLYRSIMDGLKIEQLNEGIINISGIDIMSIIMLVILILSLKSCLISVPNTKK